MRKTTWGYEVLGVLVLLVAAGCGSSPQNGQTPVVQAGDPANAKFSWIQANVYPACAKCHSGTKPAAKIDLSNYTGWIAAELITPGNPDQSAIYTQVNLGPDKKGMPLNGNKLPAEQIQAVYDWIKAGAANN